MKNSIVIILSAILISVLPSYSHAIDKNEILNIMIFPEPDLKIGRIINNPFFSLQIHNKTRSDNYLNKRIQILQKDLNYESNKDKLYELGNCYKDLLKNEKAIECYKKYLKISDLNHNEKEEIQNILNTGEIYYTLSEIDLKSYKIQNLEKSLLLFIKALELNPDNLNIWLKIGDCYLSLGRVSDAILAYNKLLKENRFDYELFTRLQAAEFERDYNKLSNNKLKDHIENLLITEGFNFDYIQTAINNASENLKDSLKTQHYIYLLRLLLFKSELYMEKNKTIPNDFNSLFTPEEKQILTDIDKFIKSINNKKINKNIIIYLSGIVDYLNSDFKKAFIDFESVLTENRFNGFIYEELLFINFFILNDSGSIKKNLLNYIKFNPDPEYYLILANLEFRNKNMAKALMLCAQSIKINKNYSEAYSAMSVIFAKEGNFTAADDIIKKGIINYNKNHTDKIDLLNQMLINEAAIALLKNENERAYILFQSVISVDNYEKASLLYNRYFNKNGKIQN